MKMVQLLKFLIPILLLCINTEAWKVGSKKEITVALPEESLNVLNKQSGVDYIPQKPAPKISKAVLLNHPLLAFLGEYKGRNFYIERFRVDQKTARGNCKNLGMKLARFDNQDQLNFIYEKTEDEDDYAWTDGVNYRNPAGFRWDTDISKIFSTALITHNNYLGLAIDRYPKNTKLAARIPTDERYYLCFL